MPRRKFEKLHKEEHVDDLMKDGRIEELVDIPEDLDCSVLRDFLNEHNKFSGTTYMKRKLELEQSK